MFSENIFPIKKYEVNIMGKRIDGLTFQQKALEDAARLKVSIRGVRSDGFTFSEDSQVFEENEIKIIINLTKKKRLMTLLENEFDYAKYGKKAGKIPEDIEDNEEEVKEYKITRQAELTITKLKACGISFPEDISEHPVPKIREFSIFYVDGNGTFPVFLFKNGKRLQ